MDDKKNAKLKTIFVKIIFVALGSGISAVILRVVTGSLPVYPVVGSGIGAILASLVSVNKQRK